MEQKRRSRRREEIRRRDRNRKIITILILGYVLIFVLILIGLVNRIRHMHEETFTTGQSHELPAGEVPSHDSPGEETATTLNPQEYTVVVTDSVDNPVDNPVDVPEEILEFVQKYPEAASFAENYPGVSDQHTEIDLTDEVTKGVIPLFIQWDERWGYELYGQNYLGINGCGPTCLSMVVCGLTGSTEWNPKAVADFSVEQGYYEAEWGTSWNLMTEGAQSLGLSVQGLRVTAMNIRNQLSEKGRAIICSMHPGDFTYTGHFIVLTGLDENGDVILNDPNSPSNSEKHWSMDVLLPQIRGMWAFTEKEEIDVDIVTKSD